MITTCRRPQGRAKLLLAEVATRVHSGGNAERVRTSNDVDILASLGGYTIQSIRV